MTSKISFFSLCAENMKRRVWLLVLTILSFFIAMPLAMMVVLQNESSYGTLSEERCLGIFGNILGMGANSVLAALLAIICAVAGFAWLFSKKKVDLYHSIPVRREKLFAVCYLNGIFIYIIPYLASTVICLLIMSRYLAMTGTLLGIAGTTFAVNVLFFLCFYNLMLVAVMLTGNMVNCLMTGGVLFVYAIAVRGLLELYLSFFIRTYYSMTDLLTEMRFASPIMAVIYFMDKFMNYDAVLTSYLTGGSFALYLLQCLVLAVLSGMIALFLYKKRPSEAAGRSIAFEKILNLYRVLLVIPLALGSGIFFAALVGGNEAVKTAWLIFGLIFGLVLSHGLIEVLFQMDIKAMFSYKKQLLATGVVVFLVAFSVRYDWYGMEKSMPDKEKLSSMAVYIAEMDEGDIYREEDGSGRHYGGTALLKEMELDNLEMPYEFAKKGMEYSSGESFDESAQRISYIVKYVDKNQKETYKHYFLPKEEAMPYVQWLYESEDYKEMMREHLQENQITDLSICDMSYATYTLEEKWISEFMEIYCREYEAITYEEARKGLAARMDFEVRDAEGRCKTRGYNLPIYTVFEESLQFLAEHGMDTALMQEVLVADKISGISLYVYDTEAYLEISGREESKGETELFLTDRKEIEKLLPYLVPEISNNFMSEYRYDLDGMATVQIDEENTCRIGIRVMKNAPLSELKFDIGPTSEP